MHLQTCIIIILISPFLSINADCIEEDGIQIYHIKEKTDFQNIDPNVTKMKLTFEAGNNLVIGNGIIPNLQFLQELVIDFLNIKSLQKGAFLNIQDLKELKLCNSDEYEPHEKTIGNDTFEGLVNLKKLEVVWIGLEYIYINSFSHLTSLEILDIRNNKLHSIPSNLFSNLPKLKDLELQYNEISDIDEGAFNNLNSLSSLKLENNNIHQLTDGILSGITNVEFLYLSNNKIQAIPRDALYNLANLKYLDISSNSITDIDKNSFNKQGLLTTLHLHDNQLQSLDENLFKSLVNIDILTLHNNYITDLPNNTFVQLKSMDVVTLSGNTISAIKTGTFSDLPDLIELDISSNMISKIDANSFDNLRKLQKLQLHNNNLYTLPSEVFSDFDSIQLLTIDANPWICNCSLSWLQNIRTNVGNLSDIFCTSSTNETLLLPYLTTNCTIPLSNSSSMTILLILVIIFILIMISAVFILVICQRRKCGFWKVKNTIDTNKMKDKRIDLVMKISDSNSYKGDDAFSKGKQNETVHAYDNTMLFYANVTDDDKLISRYEQNKINEKRLNDRHSMENNNALNSLEENEDILYKNTIQNRPHSYLDQQLKKKPIFMTSQSVDGTFNDTQFCNNAFDNDLYDDNDLYYDNENSETEKRTLPLGMQSSSSIHSIDTMYDSRTGDYRPISYFKNNDE